MFDALDKGAIKAPRYHDAIIAAIREMVMKGELVEGQTIPSERDLAEAFNVSRGPVREALKILEYLGILENRRRDGMVLRKLEVRELYEKLDFALSFDQENLRELFEVRLHLEPVAAALAAERRGEAELEEMRQAVALMQAFLAHQEPFYDASYRFHEALFGATHNRVLVSIHYNLAEQLRLSRRVTLSLPRRLQKSLQFHEKLLVAIEQQQSELAREIMQAHICDAMESLQIQEIEGETHG